MLFRIVNAYLRDKVSGLFANIKHNESTGNNELLVKVEDGVDVNSSTLPSGAATSDNQTDGSQKTQIVGPSGNIASVTEEGQAATTIFDSDGNRIAIDGLGNLKVAENSLIVGESFEGSTLDASFWDATVTNDGTVTQNGELLVDTGTTSGGTASVDSVRKARKIPGTVGQFRSVGHFGTVADANNVRTVGISDFNASENGAWFKLDGTTFKIVTALAGTETEVSSGSFNGDVTSWTPDTDVHRFVIEYTAYVVKFFIDGVLIHKVFSESEPWSKSLTLGVRVTNANSVGNTTNNEMHFQILCIVRIGKLRSAKSKHFQTGVTTSVLKRGAGAVIGLVITGVANTARIKLYDAVAATGGTEFFDSGVLDQKTEPFTIDMYGIDFFDGLTLEVATASANVTVIYE